MSAGLIHRKLLLGKVLEENHEAVEALGFCRVFRCVQGDAKLFILLERPFFFASRTTWMMQEVHSSDEKSSVRSVDTASSRSSRSHVVVTVVFTAEVLWVFQSLIPPIPPGHSVSFSCYADVGGVMRS